MVPKFGSEPDGVTPDRFGAGRRVRLAAEFSDDGASRLPVSCYQICATGMRIVAQTQAMPGYTNVLRYTFTEPGVYRVLCLEYCEIAHHRMKAQITVTAQ
jgi:hypothetical protein